MTQIDNKFSCIIYVENGDIFWGQVDGFFYDDEDKLYYWIKSCDKIIVIKETDIIQGYTEWHSAWSDFELLEKRYRQFLLQQSYDRQVYLTELCYNLKKDKKMVDK